MCDIVQAYAEKYSEKRAEESFNNGKTEGINIGRSEGVVQTLLNLVTKGSITLDSAIIDSGLKKEEFYSIAKTLGFDL